MKSANRKQTQHNNPIGISGLAAYLPPYRVKLEDWCEWTGNHWPKHRAVVGRSFRMRGPDQSVYTMAANAVLRLIRQYDIDPQRVSYLAFGTESSTDNSAGAIILKGMLDSVLPSLGKAPLSRACEVPEFKHACLGGVYAMKAAIRHLAFDGAGTQAIIVCADIAEYARGSSGEPTQGAGAVAMLLEADPTLASVDLMRSGSASNYRVMDFRKPMLRFCGQAREGSAHVQDFPVFNGKYSTTCYIDETLHAMADMYRKRGRPAIDHMRSLRYVFMHRPYRRMPETGWALAYLFALANGAADDRDELAAYAREAGIDPALLLEEMKSRPAVADLACPEGIQNEIYPLSMAVLHVFRGSDAFQREVINKLSLGSDRNRDLGNLYTAAMPAWLAAGLEQSLAEGIDLTGEELLTLGYGSGDAAEVIPFFVAPAWREATRRIRFAEALEPVIDLTEAQYIALHDGLPVEGIRYEPRDEFLIDGIGQSEEHRFQDFGIEYYRYAGDVA